MNSVKVSSVPKMKKTATKKSTGSRRVETDRSRGSAMFGVLLFLSGTAALIYQILWIRQLSLVVGVEVYSITIAVSAFFAGLAAGGAVFGRIADWWSRPYFLYSMLEAGVALVGVGATVALSHAATAFVALESRAGFLAWVLPFLLVGVPAFLMGGTLPVAIRSQIESAAPVAGTGGWIYAANTAGGIAGALLSSFLFLPRLGVLGTAIAAAVFNLCAAGIAVALNRRPERTHERGSTKYDEADVSSPVTSRTAVALYTISGGIALGYEVVWSQGMAQFLSTRVFAFSVVLAT